MILYKILKDKNLFFGHVFGRSVRKRDYSVFSLVFALVLLSFGSFGFKDCFGEVCCSPLLVFHRFSGLISSPRKHVRCVMAGKLRATFTHKKTVRLIVDDGMDLNAIEIVNSLPDFREDIAGIVPNFGGKCFDITLRTTDAATRLATSGFDYGAERKSLKLLGAKTIHISVFVAVEYPDQEVVTFLKQYGQLKSENLRRLCYTEEGFTKIERGIRVAEFISLDRDLPRKVVTQGLELYFKYTGQPMTCYRCGSTEHMVKNCPKQRKSRFQHIRVEDRTLPGPPNPPGSQESEMETSEVPSESTTNETPSSSPLLFSEPASGVTSSQPPSFASVTV